MKKTNKLEGTCHVTEIRERLNISTGLPFENILSTKAIFSALESLNLDYRTRFFTPDLTLLTFLSQVLSDDQSCQAAVARTIAFLVSKDQSPPSANTAAYCNARTRLPECLISDLTRQSGNELQAQVDPSWLWRRRHVKLIDGSTISMPDTKANQEMYPQHGQQREGVGFPIARLVTIISCATGAVLDLALGAYKGKGTGEHSLLREIQHNFQSGDVVLGDAYYCSFFLVASLVKSGVDVVFPIHGARDCDFRAGERIGRGDHLIIWKKPQRPRWMDKDTYNDFPNEIKVREVEVNDEQNGFRTEKRILVTTFLSDRFVSKKDLNELYNKRWLVEIDLRSIKQTIHMDILRGKTPAMVRKEIWCHLLAYNLIRKVMAQSAFISGKKPRELSFKLALQMIDAFRQRGIFCEKNKDCYLALLKAIAYQKVGSRPNRREPRMVKRRPKPFLKLQKNRKFYTQENKSQNTIPELRVA